MDQYEHMVTIVYDESAYRQGERTLSYTLVGTKDQIADKVREVVHSSLSYGSHITGLHIIPVNPVNVVKLSER